MNRVHRTKGGNCVRGSPTGRSVDVRSKIRSKHPPTPVRRLWNSGCEFPKRTLVRRHRYLAFRRGGFFCPKFSPLITDKSFQQSAGTFYPAHAIETFASLPAIAADGFEHPLCVPMATLYSERSDGNDPMTIRPHSLRRAVALLLTAACVGVGPGCHSMPFILPQFSRAPQVRDERPSATTEAPSANPQSPDAQRAEAAVRERSPDEACRECLATAREMEAHGKHAAAIEQYERARKFIPKEPAIAARLAVLFDRAGSHQQAADEYGIALKEDPTNADLWNDFAYFQFQRAEFVDAEISVRRALVLDPDHKRSWVTLGLIEAELERYEDAYGSFTKAVSPAAAHNNLGIILARQGKSELARKELAEARHLDPTQKQPTALMKRLESESAARTIAPSAIKRS